MSDEELHRLRAENLMLVARLRQLRKENSGLRDKLGSGSQELDAEFKAELQAALSELQELSQSMQAKEARVHHLKQAISEVRSEILEVKGIFITRTNELKKEIEELKHQMKK